MIGLTAELPDDFAPGFSRLNGFILCFLVLGSINIERVLPRKALDAVEDGEAMLNSVNRLLLVTYAAEKSRRSSPKNLKHL